MTTLDVIADFAGLLLFIHVVKLVLDAIDPVVKWRKEQGIQKYYE